MAQPPWLCGLEETVMVKCNRWLVGRVLQGLSLQAMKSFGEFSRGGLPTSLSKCVLTNCNVLNMV